MLVIGAINRLEVWAQILLVALQKESEYEYRTALNIRWRYSGTQIEHNATPTRAACMFYAFVKIRLDLHTWI